MYKHYIRFGVCFFSYMGTLEIVAIEVCVQVISILQKPQCLLTALVLHKFWCMH